MKNEEHNKSYECWFIKEKIVKNFHQQHQQYKRKSEEKNIVDDITAIARREKEISR